MEEVLALDVVVGEAFSAWHDDNRWQLRMGLICTSGYGGPAGLSTALVLGRQVLLVDASCWARCRDHGGSVPAHTKVRTMTESVHPAWHCVNLNLQVDGLPFAVSTPHAKTRRDGYQA